MGKIFILIGKSASGKDAIYRRLVEDDSLALKPYVGYTTRPIRSGEQEGREYYFTDESGMNAYEQEGRLIEKRVYHTVHGDWYYYSVDNENVDLDRSSYICTGTLESYVPMRDHYGADKVIPLFIRVEDGERLQRALDRERQQKQPRYAEMCRRFLVDAEDFSEEKILAAGITESFENIDLDRCISEIRERILAES
ncbi:MAG: guanylate kinase [Parasporobacterium sp.]|nr:guanylate kinase [Parasporobacterium sp.]